MEINPKHLLSKIGGKAYQLNRLKELVEVPTYFVVSFENPLEIKISAVQKAVMDECKTRNFSLMAVRSSAVGEDSAKASFAGMFETALCINPSHLIGAITKVLNSVYNQRVKDYCETHGFNPDSIKMSVIVQEMVHSRISGVCLTRIKDGQVLLVEACYGLGEPLVSGKITPDSYIVDRQTLTVLDESIGYQKLKLEISNKDSKRLIYEEIPFHQRNSRKLSDDEIREICETGLRIERVLHFGTADIEWAFTADRLYILQAREFTGYQT